MLSSSERCTSSRSPSDGGAQPAVDSAGSRSDIRAHACWSGGGGSSEWLAFQVDRISARDVARSLDNREGEGQEVALSTECMRLESEARHCTSPDPLLETDRRRGVQVEVEDDDRECGSPSTVSAGMS